MTLATQLFESTNVTSLNLPNIFNLSSKALNIEHNTHTLMPHLQHSYIPSNSSFLESLHIFLTSSALLSPESV